MARKEPQARRSPNAAYKSHCHDTYVWVTPDYVSALSQLTLAILDIATVDSGTINFVSPVATVDYTYSTAGPSGVPITNCPRDCVLQNCLSDNGGSGFTCGTDKDATTTVTQPAPICQGCDKTIYIKWGQPFYPQSPPPANCFGGSGTAGGEWPQVPSPLRGSTMSLPRQLQLQMQ